MIGLVITVKAVNEVSTFQHLQLFRSRPPPRPPRLTPPTLPCQPPRADHAGADRGAWKLKTVFVEYHFQTLLKLPSNQQHLVWFGCFTTGY